MDIFVQGPYNYKRVLDRLSCDPLNVIDLDKQQIKVPLQVYNDFVVATVTFEGDRDKTICHIELPSIYEEEGVKQIKQIFQLEEPLQEINQFFQTTSLKPLFEKFSGLPLILDFDLYYSFMKTIIHQQLNIRFAYLLTERFVRTYGFEKDGVWFYPSPEKISELKCEDLRELQFSQRKAEYVIDTSRLIVEKKLDLDELKVMSDEHFIETVLKIRGIGYWTAENILLFGLGRKNLFPVKDVGIQNALKKLYDLSEKPSLDEMIKLSEKWSPYKSYASLYLWESLDNQKARS